MYKKIKKINLNTSNKAHGKLLLKNLFTSLLVNFQIKTTKKKAKILKDFAQEKIYTFITKIVKKEPITKKTWLQNHILGSKDNYKKALENLKSLTIDFKISIHKIGFRAGDGAVLYEVKLINSNKEKDE